MLQSLDPVRPLARAPLLVAGLALICLVIAVAGATKLGFYGLHKLSVPERLLIFPILGILGWAVATVSAAQVAPGSKNRITPLPLVALCISALLGVFAILFHDYGMQLFVPQGVACLETGLLFAIPAGLLIWATLRRGFAVNPVSAGLAAGTLAGLTGIGVLELHCANFKAPHVMVWHVAVIPLSGLAGAMIAEVRGRLRAS
jgi:hypothetical protein